MTSSRYLDVISRYKRLSLCGAHRGHNRTSDVGMCGYMGSLQVWVTNGTDPVQNEDESANSLRNSSSVVIKQQLEELDQANTHSWNAPWNCTAYCYTDRYIYIFSETHYRRGSNRTNQHIVTRFDIAGLCRIQCGTLGFHLLNATCACIRCGGIRVKYHATLCAQWLH